MGKTDPVGPGQDQMSMTRQEERDPGHGKMSQTSGPRTAQKQGREYKELVTGIPHTTGSATEILCTTSQQHKSFRSQHQESFALRVSNRNPLLVSNRNPLRYQSATGILHYTGLQQESFTLWVSNGNPLSYASGTGTLTPLVSKGNPQHYMSAAGILYTTGLHTGILYTTGQHREPFILRVRNRNPDTIGQRREPIILRARNRKPTSAAGFTLRVSNRNPSHYW